MRQESLEAEHRGDGHDEHGVIWGSVGEMEDCVYVGKGEVSFFVSCGSFSHFVHALWVRPGGCEETEGIPRITVGQVRCAGLRSGPYVCTHTIG